MEPTFLCNLTYDELTSRFKQANFPAFRVKQVFHQLYERWTPRLENASNLPNTLIQWIDKEMPFSPPRVQKTQMETDGETKKLLLRFPDGNTTETVMIYSDSRLTQCISSQIGCPLKCTFCATGSHGFKRNLEPHEIVGQIQSVIWEDRLPDNFVFMGMGEPFLNRDAVFKSLAILHDERGAGIGYRRFTLSTAGIVEGIQRLIQEDVGIRLAISLNSPFEDQRAELMPVTKSNPLPSLMKVLKTYQNRTNHRLTFEYVLLNDVNMSTEHIQGIQQLLKGLSCYINIIPFNSFPGSRYQRPEEENVAKFCEGLEAAGIDVVRRYRKGNHIAAACGQLASF
jgi:23S rRNA (adenine2503-C2)-methyltransferase